jgi:HD-GYP domain-containing protein (c-di-GMP phosphodiesterase class II)
MIADTIDAMTTDRPYRHAMTLARAMEELEKYAGLQFDPVLVKLVAKSQTIRKLLGVESREDPLPHQPRSLRVIRQQPIVS